MPTVNTKSAVVAIGSAADALKHIRIRGMSGYGALADETLDSQQLIQSIAAFNAAIRVSVIARCFPAITEELRHRFPKSRCEDGKP